jgi:ABC-type branched-subunit amino acid transport system permease subunit
MQASSQNQLAAYYMGIPVKRVNSLIWALAGAVAAIAGILFASKGSIDPSTGLLGIKAFAASVIGGFGSLPGALLGGLIIGLIEPFASRYITPEYSHVSCRTCCCSSSWSSVRTAFLPKCTARRCDATCGRSSRQATTPTSTCSRMAARRSGMPLLVAIMVVLPFVIDDFALGEVTNLLIWSIAGMGLMILVGQTGQASLGHAAFMAVGCYANVLLQQAGLPFILSFPLAGLISGVAGYLLAMPMTKLHGIYLGIATLAISILADDLIVILEPLTNGVRGLYAPMIEIFGVPIDRYGNPDRFYFLVLIVTLLVVLVYRNLLRSPLGRSFAAVRDSEVSARAMGVNIARTKAVSFGISTAIVGSPAR